MTIFSVYLLFICCLFDLFLRYFYAIFGVSLRPILLHYFAAFYDLFFDIFLIFFGCFHCAYPTVLSMRNGMRNESRNASMTSLNNLRCVTPCGLQCTVY